LSGELIARALSYYVEPETAESAFSPQSAVNIRLSSDEYSTSGSGETTLYVTIL